MLDSQRQPSNIRVREPSIIFISLWVSTMSMTTLTSVLQVRIRLTERLTLCYPTFLFNLIKPHSGRSSPISRAKHPSPSSVSE